MTVVSGLGTSVGSKEGKERRFRFGLRAAGDLSGAWIECSEAQVLAKRLSFVLVPKQAALHKNRHDFINELCHAGRQYGAVKHETVSSPLFDPRLHVIRDFGRCPDEGMSGGGRA